jgi:4-hydroxy-tetrahydrodipicolinate synthase
LKPLRGIIPILPTPFDEGGTVDEDSLQRLVEHLISQRVHGLGTLALASEGYKLTEAEGRRVIQAVVEAAAGRVPVVVGTSHEGTRAAIERSREAATLGAEAVMLLPPYLVKPTSASLLAHFVAVAEAVEAPVVVQDSPQLTGVVMPPAFLIELARRAPNIRYVKIEGLPAGRSISAVVEALGPEFGVLCGWGGLGMLDALRRGACGCMPGADFAPALVAVHEAFHASQVEQAQSLFDPLLPLLSFAAQSLDRFVIVAKTILAGQGIITTPTLRAPFTPLDEIEHAEMKRLLHAIGWA